MVFGDASSSLNSTLALALAQSDVFRTGKFSKVLISAAAGATTTTGVGTETDGGIGDGCGGLTARALGSTCTPALARLSSRPISTRCSRSRWSVDILQELQIGKFRRLVQVAHGPRPRIFRLSDRRFGPHRGQ